MSKFCMLWELALLVSFLDINGLGIPSSIVIGNIMKPMREYEDFVLEQYKHGLLLNENLNATAGTQLENVIIATQNSPYGPKIYRALITGVKRRAKVSNLTCSDATVLCYQFHFMTLLSLLRGMDNFNLSIAQLELNATDWINLQIFVDGDELATKTSNDMSSEVGEWMKTGRKEIVLRLDCKMQCPKMKPPVLLIKVEIVQNIRRPKRKTRTDQDCMNRQCCLKTRYFEFRNSNLEHVAAPDGFLMNFCDGICDQYLIGSSNDRHTLVQAMKISDLRFNPFKHKWVCCVPTRFASVNVIEWYSEGVQRSVPLKDVKVEECGCVI